MIISYVHIQWLNCVLSAITCSSQLYNEQEFLIVFQVFYFALHQLLHHIKSAGKFGDTIRIYVTPRTKKLWEGR